MKKTLRSISGQGTTEMVFLIPLFVVLGAGAIFVSYMCWQGVKAQEAANVAARIAGQETVGGAQDYSTLLRDNGLVTSVGVNTAGDPDPSSCTQANSAQMQACLDNLLKTNGGSGSTVGNNGTKTPANGGSGVYWSYRKLVYALFSTGEQKNLFVPTPVTRGGESEVTVARVMRPPKIFGWQPPIVSIEAKAYGGEDTYMYSLPRWGETSSNGASGGVPYWETLFKNNANLKANTDNQ